jgi:hypothetical protein
MHKNQRQMDGDVNMEANCATTEWKVWNKTFYQADEAFIL